MTTSRLIKIKKGLDLPISGEPEQRIDVARKPSSVALVAADYIGCKPTMRVKPGDRVLLGEPLFEDKKNPGVMFTSPGGGEVTGVYRGEKRALQSVVIALEEDESSVEYDSVRGRDEGMIHEDEVRRILLESGLWTAFRTRPFSKVPRAGSTPAAIFVTAMDTNPLAPDPDVVAAGREEDFLAGQRIIAKLTPGNTYVCRKPGSKMAAADGANIKAVEFAGPHPAGTPGVHIHFLEPVFREKTVWHLGYQDVIAIGALFRTGQHDVRRIVSLAGPQVKSPRLLETRVGASLDDLTAGETAAGESRVISGSVFSGRTAQGEIHGYLGRFHNGVSVVEEGRERRFLGWTIPWMDQFSVLNLFLSKLSPKRRFPFNTNIYGGRRAIMPIGVYERVMPMDIAATHLLRSLFSGNTERAEQLGCLELDEEDLALCSFVCPGKNDFGVALRATLDRIEREG